MSTNYNFSNTTYTPNTKSKLARAYGVDIRTFNKWIKPTLKIIGKPFGRLFTPHQVKMIIKALGVPPCLQYL
ncbi:MAG: hypothetical protein HRT72_07315 [Flavobacteriales bacterium]|nr:hypothetical protein [Flavobacteriales bacterium]